MPAPRAQLLKRPVFVLGCFIALYVVVFGVLTWKQQSNYGTFGYDMGIYDQGIWLVSHFKEPFVTVRGLNYFGHHVNLITLLFVPAYWLGAGPHFLYVVETLAMAAGAIPVWLLARDKVDPWTALVPAAAYLLFPSLEWINWWHFHPDALIITPLLFAWWFASNKRWRPFAIATVIALLAKEDAALAVLMMGVVLVIKGERKWGVRAAVAGLAWFVICTQGIIPLANGGKEAFYEELFPGYGHSMKQIMWTMVRHPSRTYRFAVLPDRLKYYRQLLFPVGLLALAAPLVLLIAGPQLLVNVVSAHGPTHDMRYHYSSILVAVIFMATVDVFAWIVSRGRLWHGLAIVLLLGSALVANKEWSPSPVGNGYDEAWITHPGAHQYSVDHAVRLVRPGDKVAATHYIVPHLTHRQYIYEFPNPFLVHDWGINGEDPADVNTCDTLVLDLGLTDKEIFNQLVGPYGAFKVVFQENNVIVARRMRPT